MVKSQAFLAHEKKSIYSEYSFKLQTILKADNERKLNGGDIIMIDREGGIVRYPNGQKLVYFVDNQNHPEVNGRYLFFLDNDVAENPNYKIITAYQLKGGLVTALDTFPNFDKLNGKGEADLVKLTGLRMP